jgi:hypothetical protein
MGMTVSLMSRPGRLQLRADLSIALIACVGIGLSATDAELALMEINARDAISSRYHRIGQRRDGTMRRGLAAPSFGAIADGRDRLRPRSVSPEIVTSPGGIVAALCLVALAALPASGTAAAQEIESRLYSNAPVGMNFLAANYTHSVGILQTDPDAPIQNAHLRVQTPVLGYARILDIAGMSGKFDVALPLASFSGSADVYGRNVSREIAALSDPAFRFSVNFIGAPALSLKQFQSYRQDLIVGASILVSAPLGQYDSTKLINFGNNRWKLRPELGASKAIGPFVLEAAQGVVLFGANDDYFGGHTLEQNPIYTTRANLIYRLSTASVALNALYFTGGRTSVDGVPRDDRIETWRFGATLTFDLDRYNSLKLYGSRGLTIGPGTNYDIVGASWQYKWGAGL